MTVLIYVNTSKQVGDVDHFKVFANADAAETWFEELIPKVSRSSMRSWSECGPAILTVSVAQPFPIAIGSDLEGLEPE